MEDAIIPKILNPHTVSRANAIVAAAFSSAAGFLIATPSADAATTAAKGKCGLLLEQSYSDRCTIIVKKNSITLLPKSSGSIRILPQLVSYFSLADKSTLKVDETLALYENIRPWWLGGVPGWVKKAMSTKQDRHQFVIGYLNQDFEPSMALFEVSDSAKASGIFLELAKATGLRTGEYRDINKAIDPRLKRSLLKDANRQAKRVAGLCTSRMFDDAEPVLEKLDTFVYNRSNEISIFRGSEATTSKLEQIAGDARDYCEKEFKRELAEIDAARRARLEAIRRKEAQRRAAAAAARARAAEAARLKARSAFDMLASY